MMEWEVRVYRSISPMPLGKVLEGVLEVARKC